MKSKSLSNLVLPSTELLCNGINLCPLGSSFFFKDSKIFTLLLILEFTDISFMFLIQQQIEVFVLK